MKNELSAIEKEVQDQIKAHSMANQYYLQFKKQFESRKVAKYKTIFVSGKCIDEDVNDAIKTGWEPIGGICMVWHEEEGGHDLDEVSYCQAMVKYE